ncbi:type II secretion system protein GspK [Stenotrophomonas sp. YIM B06876]|uniref:general secretion pathway protein GspK n=1 Tax=Stenotrophomonas sp. YIM B06876 TaxID=3060211 RepID=UPI00273A4357|nr:type II secretion system protein GspK [Stenotrophomonas sp. YIM B06876]
MRRCDGAALVLVLWLVVLLTAVVGAFALTAKVEHLQGRMLGETAAAQEQARAGVEYALSRLQGAGGQPPWQPDGRRYRWRFDGRQVDLRIVDEAGKVDLNLADAALLEGLLQAVGSDPARARQLAGAIVDWRDRDELRQPVGGAESADYAAAGLPYGAKNLPFESHAELQRLLGMDAALYAQLAPLVTVFGGARPDPRFAPAPVLTAMGLDAALLLAQREAAAMTGGDGDRASAPAPGSGTYSIDSRVQLRGARQAVLQAVVRGGSSGVPGAAYTVVRWEQGTVSR